jgi:hypothetical protein
MQQYQGTDAGSPAPSPAHLSPGERTELEEIELLAELMILANKATAKAQTDEIDQALGLSHDLTHRNAS